MNFLAHYVLIRDSRPSPMLVLGNALPDLLPLASSRARFRCAFVDSAPASPLRDGVRLHLDADAAFHQSPTFAHAQSEMKALLRETNFIEMRIRPFFLAHVLAELALDAALLRADPTLAARFYAAFAAADFDAAARWSAAALGQSFPNLSAVLERFLRSRYLQSYRDDAGVAEGLSRLCARTRQDTFQGANFRLLTAVVGKAVAHMAIHADTLLEETLRPQPMQN